MITLLLHLFRVLPFLFGGHRQLALENLALRHQLAVYKRTVSRPPLRRTDRLCWVALARVWADWRRPLVIVTPDTVLRWQRRRFRQYWTKLSARPTAAARLSTPRSKPWSGEWPRRIYATCCPCWPCKKNRVAATRVAARTLSGRDGRMSWRTAGGPDLPSLSGREGPPPGSTPARVAPILPASGPMLRLASRTLLIGSPYPTPRDGLADTRAACVHPGRAGGRNGLRLQP
jgi:hypothetical protein